MRQTGQADIPEAATAREGVAEDGGSAIPVGRAAGPLILSDVLLQGIRYLLLLYLGYRSLTYVGAFLLGSALGAVLGGMADFGINQHWLRLTGPDMDLTQQTFSRVLRGKVLACLGGLLCLGGGMAVGAWSPSLPMAMVVGTGVAATQVLAETYEAVGLLLHRYHMVALFRVLMSVGMYGVPLVLAWTLQQEATHAGLDLALLAGLMIGVLLCGVSAWKMMVLLPGRTHGDRGYCRAWWEARWLGLNQIAIVLDVRAPLLILGFMLGAPAVGLYGLVQRTTAVVELAWASLSRLLVRSYAEMVGEKGVHQIKARVRMAGSVTVAVMVIASAGLWSAIIFYGRFAEVSTETALALSLLQWAVVAIGFSSVKRPFVSGLVALFQERLVCRVNVTAALVGLLLVPLCIRYWGIWGPVMAWIVLEVAACLVLVLLFFYVSSQAGPALVTRTSGGMGGYTK